MTTRARTVAVRAGVMLLAAACGNGGGDDPFGEPGELCDIAEVASDRCAENGSHSGFDCIGAFQGGCQGEVADEWRNAWSCVRAKCERGALQSDAEEQCAAEGTSIPEACGSGIGGITDGSGASGGGGTTVTAGTGGTAGAGGAGGSGGSGGSGGTGVDATPTNHRPSAVACSNDREPGHVTMSDPGGECSTDADCADGGTNGRCYTTEGGGIYNFCSYDTCFLDTDCMAGEPCSCREGARGNTCGTGSNCVVDADCGPGGFCSPSGINYACHTPEDECTNDEDCVDVGSAASCEYNSALKHWTCKTPQLVP